MRIHILHGVEVLRHHHHLHDILARDVVQLLLEVHHGLAESVDDRLALARDTGACGFRLGVRLGRLDDHDLLRLGAILRGDALRCAALISFIALFTFWSARCPSEGLNDGVAELGHRLLQHVLDLGRDFLLGGEHVVEDDSGHGGAHHVEDVRTDLLARVREPVEGSVPTVIVGDHHVLSGDDDGDENVVLGLGLDGDVEGLDAG